MSTLEQMPQPIKEKILKQANDPDDYEPMPNTFAVTELLYCLKKTCLKRVYGKRPVDLDTANNFYRGNKWDQDFTAEFHFNQIRCTHRCRNVPICINGKFDFLDDTNPDTPTIVDLKSPKNLYFVKKEGPSIHYIRQIRFYCYCNAQTRGRIDYFDGSTYLQFPVDVTENLLLENINWLEERAAALYKWKQTGKLPTKTTSTPDPWECRFCQYRQECDEDEAKQRSRIRQ